MKLSWRFDLLRAREKKKKQQNKTIYWTNENKAKKTKANRTNRRKTERIESLDKGDRAPIDLYGFLFAHWTCLLRFFCIFCTLLLVRTSTFSIALHCILNSISCDSHFVYHFSFSLSLSRLPWLLLHLQSNIDPIFEIFATAVVISCEFLWLLHHFIVYLGEIARAWRIQIDSNSWFTSFVFLLFRCYWINHWNEFKTEKKNKHTHVHKTAQYHAFSHWFRLQKTSATDFK